MKKAAFLLMTTVVFFSAQATEHRYVRVPAQVLNEELVRSTDFIRDHIHDDTYAFGYLTDDAYRRLPQNVRAWFVTLDAYAWAQGQFDTKTLLPIVSNEPPVVGPVEDYHTYKTLTDELKMLAAKYPDLMTLSSTGKSVDGRDLWLVRLTAAKNEVPGKPKLLYISSMHGDEVAGKEMMVYMIREMLSKYGTDDRLTSLMNYAEIFVMPSMNPDGTERKQRFNAKGVDLNRNFPEVNESGLAPGHAIEVQAIQNLHKNNHFVLAMNFHGGTVCFNLPWDHKPNPQSEKFGDDAMLMRLARVYADKNDEMYDNHQGSFNHGVTYGYEWYQVLGGMQDWAITFFQSAHATLEISGIKWPSASTLGTIWGRNRDSMLSYLEGGMDGIHLKVVDESNNLVKVAVDVNTAKRTLKYDGYVHRPTTPGDQEVTLQTDGYAKKTLRLPSTRFSGRYETVIMTK